MKQLIKLFTIASFLTLEIHSQILCDPVIHSFHPHPYQCDKFILCFWGNQVELRCSPGLHYNRETSQCMRPELANCLTDVPPNCETDNPNKIIFIASRTDCARYFVCYNGEAIVRQCASGFWWDFNENWCTTPENVNCHPDTPNNPKKFQCPVGVEGTTFHHNVSDCGKYYICINGEENFEF